MPSDLALVKDYAQKTHSKLHQALFAKVLNVTRITKNY